MPHPLLRDNVYRIPRCRSWAGLLRIRADVGVHGVRETTVCAAALNPRWLAEFRTKFTIGVIDVLKSCRMHCTSKAQWYIRSTWVCESVDGVAIIVPLGTIDRRVRIRKACNNGRTSTQVILEIMLVIFPLPNKVPTMVGSIGTYDVGDNLPLTLCED